MYYLNIQTHLNIMWKLLIQINQINYYEEKPIYATFYIKFFLYKQPALQFFVFFFKKCA